jgi:hypothetical protein
MNRRFRTYKRTSATVGLALSALLLGNSALSQTMSDSELQAEIAALKSELHAQQRRLERLEIALKERTGGQSPTVQAAFPWHDPANWKRVRGGMSRAQVEAILGKPTRTTRDAINYTTLLYSGERRGSGLISGNVKLDDTDRVLAHEINIPAF